MHAPRRKNLPVLIGLTASVLAHVAVILPVLMVAMTGPPPIQAISARFDPEDISAPEIPPPPPEAKLGIEEESDPSSLSWIGYEEYEEHLATLAEQEQAAFTDDPVTQGLPTAVPEVVQTPTEVTNPAQPAEPAKPVETVEAPKPAEEASGALATAVDPSELLAANNSDETVPVDVETESPRPEGEVAKPTLAPPEKEIEEPIETEQDTEAEAESEAETDAETPPEQPAEPAEPPPTEADPQEPVPPGEIEPEDGTPADKESDATSTIDVPLDQIKLGKPIARQGLELMPRRPKFTTLTLLTAAPCNPVVRISFGRGGRPLKAEFIKSSCDSRVDLAIENSLYRWRAKGEEITRLGENETVDVQLQIMLR